MDGSGVAADIDALVVGMVGMFFLTLVIILFVVVYQRKLLRQQNKLKEAEEAHQLELLQATIESQEVERDRIGRELHDGVGGMLSTTRLYVQHWKGEDEEGKEAASDKVDELLGQTIESVREISADLRPVILENLGLEEAINELVRHINEAGHLSVTFEAHYGLRLELKEELNIYRVVQELLSNTIRHSGASQVLMEMTSQHHAFRLSYRDNGKGLPAQDGKKGLGLKNMESRINALEGTFNTHNPEEGGVLFTIEIDKSR